MTTPRIILVDDNADDLTLMAAALRQQGYDVHPFATARQGMDAIASLHPHLFVTDTIMEEMEGVETLTQLRRDFPELPVLVVSGENSYLDFMPELGAAGVAAKTLEFDLIVEEAARILSDRA